MSRMTSRRNIIILAVAVVLITLTYTVITYGGLFSIFGSKNNDEDVTPGSAGMMNIGLQVGYYAPDFKLPSVRGGEVSLSQFRGDKPVLINIWQMSCPYCQMEMGHLKDLYDEYSDKVEILSVSVDPNYSVSDLKKWADNKDYLFNILSDQSYNVVNTYKVTGVPYNFFLNKKGIITKIVRGYVDEAQLRTEFDRML